MIDPMSQMLGGGPSGPGGPPPSIQIPGGGGGGDQGGQEDPIAMMGEAKDLLRRVLEIEPDHEDKLLLEKMLTQAQQYITAQQQLVDTATGAGPGAKLMRKAGAGASSGSY